MPGRDVLHVAVDRSYVVWSGIGGRMPKKTRQAAEQREDLVLLRLRPEQFLQLADLVRVLRRQVLGLGEVIGQVVQLPAGPSRGPTRRARTLPWSSGVTSHGIAVDLAQATSRPCTSPGCRGSRSTAGCGVPRRPRRRRCTRSSCRASAPARSRRRGRAAGCPATSRIVGPMSMQWVNWRAQAARVLDPSRPADDHPSRVPPR